MPPHQPVPITAASTCFTGQSPKVLFVGWVELLRNPSTYVAVEILPVGYGAIAAEMSKRFDGA
jgi:hypothetical protein